MNDVRIERLRLDLGDVMMDPDRLRRLVLRVATLLAQRIDERAPRASAGAPQAHEARDVSVRVDGAAVRNGAGDEELAGTIAGDVADALLGRLL